MNFSPILRKLFDMSRLLLTIATVLVILLAIIGHIVRDRTIVLVFMMYLPLVPLGVWAIFLDLSQAGRSLPTLRFALTFIGLGLIVWGSITLIGTGNSLTNVAPNTVSLLHWNVKWGGVGYDNYLINRYNGDEWASIRADISQRQPDIIVLSEPPQLDSWLTQLTAQMGTHWSLLKHYRTKRNGLAIASAWPLQLERRIKIRRGVAISVVVTVRNHRLRLLLIDCARSVRKLKTPQLTDIIQAAIESEKQGQPIDMIIGDFNAVSRSVGFDAYREYQLAGEAALIWRGTWPSILPLYDIDHIWLHKRLQIVDVEMFTNLNTDHRGQWVHFNFR